MIEGTVKYDNLNTVLCKRNYKEYKKDKEYFILSVQSVGLIIAINPIISKNEIIWVSDSAMFYFKSANMGRHFPLLTTYFIAGLKERRKVKIKKIKC